MNRTASYTSANQMPWKLLQAREALTDEAIPPLHVQLVPTNRCTGRCSWCSCANEDRSLELDLGEIIDILCYFSDLGTRAITITGGGEPTLHPHLEDLLLLARQRDIQCGLVTNGLGWSRKTPEELLLANELLSWLRMSIVDTVGNYDCQRVRRISTVLPGVDVGLSFTVARQVNLRTAVTLCQYAAELENVTHIRFVQDITNPVASTRDQVVAACRPITDKALFQYRADHGRGTKDCLLSKLKPLVAADGYVYPCCGVQYAVEQARRLPERFRMCHWTQFHKTGHFDGSICRRCFYVQYNETLSGLRKPLEHARFL